MNYFNLLLIILFLIGIALITLGSIYLNNKPNLNKFVDTIKNIKENLKTESRKEHFNAEKQGIVIVAGGPVYGPLALRLVKRLRDLTCLLAIEVWTLNVEESHDNSIIELSKMSGIKIKNLEPYYDPKTIPKSKRELGYIGKSLALYNSEFTQILLLDADNYALEDPTNLFDLLDKHPAILWQDIVDFDSYKKAGLGSKGFGIDNMEKAFKNLGLQNYHKRTQYESGQMLFNRDKCYEALHFITNINLRHDVIYNIFLGDKDTYALGLEMYNIPFLTVPYKPAFLGLLVNNTFKGYAFAQLHPLTKKPLFAHFCDFGKKYNLEDITHIQYPNDNSTYIRKGSTHYWTDGNIEKFTLSNK